jgi:hypothetical protein
VASVFLNSLERQIADLAKEKKLEGARVLHKVNARGELVIALILPIAYAHHGDEERPPRKYTPLR